MSAPTEANTDEGEQDAAPGLKRATQRPGDFGLAPGAICVRHRRFQNAQTTNARVSALARFFAAIDVALSDEFEPRIRALMADEGFVA